MSIAVGRQSSLAIISTWSDIGSGASDEIGGTLTTLLTDVFALCLKTNDFHRHMSGRHLRDYHLMLDGQADEMIAVTDVIAEQVRKIAGRTIRTIGEVVRRQRLDDCDDEVSRGGMLTELYGDCLLLLGFLREAHAL